MYNCPYANVSGLIHLSDQAQIHMSDNIQWALFIYKFRLQNLIHEAKHTYDSLCTISQGHPFPISLLISTTEITSMT